ncbi:MAG: response regulator [Chitinispirillales bacterium]|nr:response regulator [Chitinispirillales bacterium]
MLASVKNKLPVPESCQSVNPMGRMLVIDDDHSVLFALKRIFRSPNIIADTCDSLESAKYCLDHNRYQLVLTDLDFCKEVQYAGIEICAYIKSTQPDVKVILWTGSQCEALDQKAKAVNVDFLFQKPLSPQIIKKIVENLYFWG